MKCLVIDEMHDSIKPLLDGINVEYDYRPDITRAEIKEILPDYDGLILRSKTSVDADLIKDSKLLFVARAGAGIENLDEELLGKKGIEIINAPEGNRDAVGEHTIGLILNLLNNISRSHDQVLKGQWKREENRGYELGSLTVGIIGYGNSGSSLAKKLAGFGCKVIAYDKYIEELPDDNAQMVNMDSIYEETDILSLHIPLTDETRALADNEFFSRFKKNIIFINTSRGEIAPVHNILNAINNEKIKSAGLDVLECEKFSNLSHNQVKLLEELKDTGSVLFTPHIAGWTFESYAKINKVIADKISEFLDQYNKLK
ncbi:MAG: NAD(P)-dependent oxidoreductase [Bacteroidota bacterium]